MQDFSKVEMLFFAHTPPLCTSRSYSLKGQQRDGDIRLYICGEKHLSVTVVFTIFVFGKLH